MINLVTPVNNLGYGTVGRYVTKELAKLTEVHLTILGQAEGKDAAIDLCTNRPHFADAPCLRIYHQFALKEFIGRGKHVGFPIFELDTFTDIEKHHLNSLDELFVCSHWAARVVKENGIQTPVKVVPLGVDTAIFNPAKSHQTPGRTIFFNCGKWEVRKGHPEIAEAFNRAFDVNDKVELWLMCDNPFYPQELTDKFRRLFTTSKLASKIKFISRVGSHLQVAKIMGQATVGVFPARAEGWNLELLEMMAMGKRVITTNYSGHTAFCNKENSCLIEPTGLQLANDGIWFHGQGNWCKFDTDELATIMRDEHDRNLRGDNMINNNGILTANQYTWQNTAKTIHQLLC